MFIRLAITLYDNTELHVMLCYQISTSVSLAAVMAIATQSVLDIAAHAELKKEQLMKMEQHEKVLNKGEKQQNNDQQEKSVFMHYLSKYLSFRGMPLVMTTQSGANDVCKLRSTGGKMLLCLISHMTSVCDGISRLCVMAQNHRHPKTATIYMKEAECVPSGYRGNTATR